MKIRVSFMSIVAIVLLAAGCGRDEPFVPDQESAAQDKTGAAPLMYGKGPLPEFYTFAANHDPNTGGFTELERIDLMTGQGTILWGLSPQADENGVLCPLGLAFDLDGSMYTYVNWAFGPVYPGQGWSRLARVDFQTGALTYIGDVQPIHFSSTVFDDCGQLYAMGFNIGPNLQDPPPVFIGNSIFYKIDKRTGAITPVGDTGIPDIMDMAFDSHGRLYGTRNNELYLFDTGTGAATFVTNVTGVPDNACGTPLELMSIAFDARDVLWATAIEGFAMQCYETTPVMTVDIGSGTANVVGWTEQWYNHGGDIRPAKVLVCHRKGKAGYTPIEISLSALPAHRAHGDVVPGVDTEDCNCPTKKGHSKKSEDGQSH